MKLLSSSIDLDDGYEDYDEDNDDGEDEYDISDYIKDYDENCENLRKLAKSEMLQFSKAVKKNVPDIKQIANIELKRIWQTWGEGASDFVLNLDCMAEELPMLAKRVCESEGDEKETAKKELAEYLSHFNGNIWSDWGGSFPSGFLGVKTDNAIVWNERTDDIETFANDVLHWNIPNLDYAVETVEIDMQSHKISGKGEYIIQKDIY